MNNYYNCIYMYKNKINGKCYIGQAKNFNKRHEYHTAERNNKFPIDKAFNKYGKENFEIIILKENLSTQCLMNFWECYYINKYDVINNKKGYNISSGGSNGNNFIGKTEEEMKEIRKKMSASNWQKGENHSFYGKHHTNETKKKMSESKKGEKNNFYGKNHTEKAKKKISEANSKKIIQYDLNGNLIKKME